MSLPDNYSGNGTIYGGQAAPTLSALPAWAAAAQLNTWMEVPGTSSAGGALLYEFSSFVRVGAKIYASLTGGHAYTDNRTTAIDMRADTPTWALLDPPSASSDVIANASHYADGKPSSRHTRFLPKYMPSLGIVHLSARDVYGVPPSFGAVDVYNLSTNTWAPKDTYPSLVNSGFPNAVDGGGCLDPNGDGWVYSCTYKFDRNTHTWSKPLTTTVPTERRVRYPWCTAPTYMFGLCWGDGWYFRTGPVEQTPVNAIRQIGNVQEIITFNPSAALTQFINDIPGEAGMAYDPINDRFLFYSGQIAGQFFEIKPNASTVWDMSLVTFSGPTPPLTGGAGIQDRFQYSPEFKGLFLYPKQGVNFFFLPLAL